MAITAGNTGPLYLSRSDDVRSKMWVQLFHGDGLLGTRATVIVADVEPAGRNFQAACLNHDSEAVCWVWPQGRQVQVRCFHRGRPIRFCGHGLLASAHAWQCCHPDEALTEVHTATATYGITRDNGLWLHCDRIFTYRASSFPEHWFDSPPEQAATAGGNNGYWVFRWPRGYDLKCIGPRLDIMARETRCGVIATAEKDADCSVTVRYFAPAYGQPEDSATGSAAVILADYWGQSRLRLEQRSARGGFLKTRLSTDSVALSGAIRGLHEETGTE